jgi:hypothetical protein
MNNSYYFHSNLNFPGSNDSFLVELTLSTSPSIIFGITPSHPVPPPPPLPPTYTLLINMRNNTTYARYSQKLCNYYNTNLQCGPRGFEIVAICECLRNAFIRLETNNKSKIPNVCVHLSTVVEPNLNLKLHVQVPPMSAPFTFDFVIEYETARSQLDIVGERVSDLQKLYLQTQMDIQSILTELNNKKNIVYCDASSNQPNIVWDASCNNHCDASGNLIVSRNNLSNHCDASSNLIIDASSNRILSNNIVFAVNPKQP